MDLVLSVHALPQELNTSRTSDYIILKSLQELKQHIEDTPRMYDKIIVDETTVTFNSINLNALERQLDSGFISFNKLIYVTTRPVQEANIVFNNIFKKYKFELIQVSALNSGIITNVINGEIVQQAQQKYSIIHKVKISDYIKKNGGDVVKHSKPIITKSLQDVPLEHIESTNKKVLLNVMNFNNFSTSVFVSLIYNNLRINNKVFAMEFDKFNYFSDYEVRLGIRDYVTNIDDIDDSKSCLFLHKDYSKSTFDIMFNFIYNNTRFDYYINILDPKKLYNVEFNTYIPITPTVDTIMELLQILNKYKTTHIELILIYKGFIDTNELTPDETYKVIKMNSDIDFNISSYIVEQHNK